jgi:hypothetical protein
VRQHSIDEAKPTRPEPSQRGERPLTPGRNDHLWLVHRDLDQPREAGARRPPASVLSHGRAAAFGPRPVIQACPLFAIDLPTGQKTIRPPPLSKSTQRTVCWRGVRAKKAG